MLYKEINKRLSDDDVANNKDGRTTLKAIKYCLVAMTVTCIASILTLIIVLSK